MVVLGVVSIQASQSGEEPTGLQPTVKWSQLNFKKKLGNTVCLCVPVED